MAKKIKKLQIAIDRKTSMSYFYYPSISCKTKDGELKMLLKQLEEEKEPYELKIREIENGTK